MNLIDSQQREQATDPRFSFIVQAPAGSGKTEILTQRYLRLLSTVKAPEQIIALTFTRKAANEMRQRILLALQQAANHTPATSPHQQKTLNHAKKALEQDSHLNWNLLGQAHRLKIITLDSLCQSINQAIPIFEQHIPYPQIAEHPERYYQQAAKTCIQFAIDQPEYQNAIRILLIHVDNKQERLISLFKSLLSQREQWLRLLYQAQAQEKSSFEEALKLIEQQAISYLISSLPATLAQNILQLTQQLVNIENDSSSPRYILKDWEDFTCVNQSLALALCKTLLTNSNFRKSFDHHLGLKKDKCSPNIYKELKQASQDLLCELNDYPDFLHALIKVSQLPKPEYDLEQWEVLQALFALLPMLTAQLQILFEEHHEIDFISMAQQGLAALGDEDNPTDLALYFDQAIHHLLIDEFQDTSSSQFALISKLVQGWQEDKTLFIVGDPMQSIYRFRQAEVGLFFKAKQQGIGPVALEFLQLSCNFRSTPLLINWVNTQFATLFPQTVQIESGAVSFHPSADVLEEKDKSAVHAHCFDSKEQEAQFIIESIKKEFKEKPNQSIAILVRSRTQLSPIINLLKTEQIPFQGVDIDLLAHLEHLRDIWSLTEALLRPANRLAWLALLRSPYCGLELQDLLYIAQFNKQQSIYQNLLQLDKIVELSEEGRIRAQFFTKIMHAALSQRSSASLSEWIVHTFKKLQGYKLLTPSQLKDLEQFLDLLDQFEEAGRLHPIEEFKQQFSKLYSEQSATSGLQIMTIHKSKGLEFDTVFLPGLGNQPNRGDKPLLQWLKIPTIEQGDLLLVSPIQAAHQENCPLYDHLSQLEQEKNTYEAQRVLYVAATRAKSGLYLTDSSVKSAKNSFRSFLKNQEFLEQEQGISPVEEVRKLPSLLKLPLKFYQSKACPDTTNYPSVIGQEKNLMMGKLWTDIPRQIGILTHKMLHWLCEHHPKSQDALPWNWILTEFKKLGFDEEKQQEALSQVKQLISNMMQDPRGSWILAPHEKELNEYELLVSMQDSLETRIIDRLFEDQGLQWIIDFKTGKDEALDQKHHMQQLNEYAFYLTEHSNYPIHCGIYYLNNNHWISWDYLTIKRSDRSSA